MQQQGKQRAAARGKLEDAISRAADMVDVQDKYGRGFSFTCVYGEVRGPFWLGQLRYLEAERAIRSDTIVSHEILGKIPLARLQAAASGGALLRDLKAA